MTRLLSLLMMLVLALGNSAAGAAALCQHGTAEVHASARQSDDARIASVAIVEEAAEAAASRDAALADAAGAQLGGFVLPAEPLLPTPRALSASHGHTADSAKRPSLAVSPLLEPPLA